MKAKKAITERIKPTKPIIIRYAMWTISQRGFPIIYIAPDMQRKREKHIASNIICKQRLIRIVVVMVILLKG